VAGYLYDVESLAMDSMEYELGKKITTKKIDHFHREEYEIVGKR
jgi:hypothetical protein